MTEESKTVSPKVQDAINGIYNQGFLAGEEKGYATGYTDGIKSAIAHLTTMMDHSATLPNVALTSGIEALNLSMRAYNSLKRQGLHSVGELTTVSEEYLLTMHNFGARSIDEVKRKLALFGYRLAPSSPEFEPTQQ